MSLRRLFSTANSETARKLIEKVVKENDVVVFMKGSASKPMVYCFGRS
jgi:glutaredoxin-related protein